MNHPFVRTQPAKLRMLSKFLRDRPEIRHQLFNIPANQFLAKPFDDLADQLVPQAQRKHDTGAGEQFVGAEQGGGKCVLGSRVDRIASRTLLEREANVTCFQGSNPMLSHVSCCEGKSSRFSET